MIRTLTRLGLGALTVAVILLFVGVALAAAPASAQETTANSTEAQPTEQYDTLGDLVVHSVDFRGGDDPTAVVTVSWRGKTPGRLTFTQLPKSGNDVLMSRQSVTPQERTKITLDLVAKNQPLVLYTDQSIRNQSALRLDDSNGGGLVSGPWDSRDAQITGAAGLLSGLFVTFVFAWRRSSPSAQDPERKL